MSSEEITQISPETSLIPAAIASHGYAVLPAFVDQALLGDLRSVLIKRREDGLFRPAGVGRGDSLIVSADVRRDQMSWIECPSADPVVTLLLERLSGLRKLLNQHLQLGLWDLEAHFSVYPPGGFYRRHVDRFRSDDAREMSIVLYLNRDWTNADGGELVIFDGDQEVLVSPVGGTLVCFRSENIPHEVRPSHDRERWSIAGWFRRRSLTGF